jgi:3-methyladenine DNA glycosylase AlkD
MSAAADVVAIKAELAALGTADRAVAEKAYLKSERIHFGTAVPDVRAVAKRWLRSRPDLGHDALLEWCRAGWDEPVHECHMVVVELLVLRPKLIGPADLPWLEQLIRDSRTWALADPIAGTVVSRLAAAEPATLEVLDRWVTDPDFWVRRSAVLGLRAVLSDGREADRFFAYADRLLPESEFFIRKVLGWVARELGALQPVEVSAWLRRNLAGMNGVTLREAVKPLPDGAEIVEAWKRGGHGTRRNKVG